MSEFMDPYAFLRDLPEPRVLFPHRVAIHLDATATHVGEVLSELPSSTIVWGAYVDTRASVGDQLVLCVALVHPRLDAVPEMQECPRVTLDEFLELVV